MKTRTWLDIDVRGFAQSLRLKGAARIALEPISNALDTDGTEIDIHFTRARNYATLIVVDNDPAGFQDLADCWTLYAPSRRRDDAEKRGRFGQGEKELIALCADGGELQVSSRTGTVTFDRSGRSVSRRNGRQSGSEIQARFRMSAEETEEFEALVRGLLVPANVSLRFQSAVIESRVPVRIVESVALDTVVADDDGVLRRRVRQTDVELYEPKSDERPTLFELGIPVVEQDGRFHINVRQKVPLNRDRDNITPAYRKALNAAVVTATADLLTQTDAERGWVREALPQIEPNVAAELLVRRFGPKTAVYDLHDREASKTLQDEGYTIVYGGSLSVEEHDIVRKTGVFQPAGRIRPSGIECSADGQPPISPTQWTMAMKAMADYIEELGFELLNRKVSVAFYDIPRTNWLGCSHSSGMVALNIGTLGRKWIEMPDPQSVDALLLHEFAHLTGVSDHLTREFNSALERLGARLRTAHARLGTGRRDSVRAAPSGAER